MERPPSWGWRASARERGARSRWLSCGPRPPEQKAPRLRVETRGAPAPSPRLPSLGGGRFGTVRAAPVGCALLGQDPAERAPGPGFVCLATRNPSPGLWVRVLGDPGERSKFFIPAEFPSPEIFWVPIFLIHQILLGKLEDLQAPT